METVITRQENAVLTIVLNRPEVYNGFNREMSLALQGILKKVSDDANTRAVIITGAGKAFSSGQDLKEVTAPDGPTIEKIINEHYNPIIRAIVNCEKPVIAAVNGVAAGAGANIALACDIVLASRSASFIQAFSKIGLIPDSGGTFFLPRIVGAQNAMALMMTGDPINAEEAWRIGLIYKIVEDEKFTEETQLFAQKLAIMPTRALAYIKKVVRESYLNTLDMQLETELKFQKMAGATSDFKEGINAFLEKRKPTFNGY
ncbi:MAG: enoyl-CoA hydratase-related protein [Saprospiraceae bacterium]